MFLVCGSFDPSYIQYVIFDNDNTLIDYKPGEAGDFSFFTAMYLREAITRLLNSPNIDSNLLIKLMALPTDHLTGLCEEAYANDGSTTEWLRDYGLDPTEIYIGHHDLIVREVINKNDYIVNHDANLNFGLLRLQWAGISTSVFTNGTTGYAESKLIKAGLRKCFNGVYGIETLVDQMGLSYKHQTKTWIKFLLKLEIPTFSGFRMNEHYAEISGAEKKWSNCVMVDDDPRVLEVAKSFGFQTVLKVTDRVDWENYKECGYIDVITDDLPRLCYEISSRQTMNRRCACNI